MTERQHRFLDLVLRHSGVFVGRQYATFAGITHGQKVHDFIARLLAHGYARPIALGPNQRTWAAQMTLASPLHMDQMPELLWFFEVTSRADTSELRQHAERLRAARRVFRGPRFMALRRWWHQVGDAPLYVVKSQVLLDQMERGRGTVEVVEAPHDYRYLRSLAGLPTPGGGERWGDEPHGRDVHLTGAANAARGKAPNSPER